MALMFLDRKAAAVLVASVSIACTPGSASSTSLAPLARNGAERFGSSAMEKTRRLGWQVKHKVPGCCSSFLRNIHPKKKLREASSMLFVSLVAGV